MIITAATVMCFGLFGHKASASEGYKVSDTVQDMRPAEHPSAIFGGGCFWCVESEFRTLDGVSFTRVGYSGGALDHPSYHDITTGESGHAEVVEVTYDPSQISYRDLVHYFLKDVHDPTQLNRQGVDQGTQYRSVIFYQNETQEMIAKEVIATANASGMFNKDIVTEIAPAPEFWMAEDHHQQFYEKYQKQTGRPHIRVLLKNK